MNGSRMRGEPFDNFFAALQLESCKTLQGCGGALGAVCLAAIARQAGVSLLLTTTPERAKDLASQVKTWLGPFAHRLVCMLPERDSIYDQTAADPEVMSARLAAMSLETHGGGLVIAPVAAVLERFFNPEKWLSGCFEVRCGSDLRRDDLLLRLVKTAIVALRSLKKRVLLRSGAVCSIYSRQITSFRHVSIFSVMTSIRLNCFRRRHSARSINATSCV